MGSMAIAAVGSYARLYFRKACEELRPDLCAEDIEAMVEDAIVAAECWTPRTDLPADAYLP